jgi:anti-sigma factor ChrR (cupin superfamily)
MREAMKSNNRATLHASIELADTIQSAKEAAARLNKRVGRFEIYSVLKSLYRVYMRWKNRGVARRSARLMAQELSITRRKGTSPMRVCARLAAEVNRKRRRPGGDWND